MCTSYVDQNSCDSKCTSVKYYVIDNGEFVCKQNSTYAFRTGLQNSACPPGFSVNATGEIKECVSGCESLYRDSGEGKNLACVDTCEEYVVKQDSKRICVSNCSLYGMKYYMLRYDRKVTPGKAKICTRECPSLHTEAEECVEECAPGQYLYEKTCYENRPLKCPLYTQMDMYFYCVQACPENRPRQLKTATDAWRCECTCATRFVDEDGACLRSCGETLFQTGFETCGAQCPSPAPYAMQDSVFGHRTYVSRCPNGVFAEIAGGVRTCVSGCGSSDFSRISADGSRECVPYRAQNIVWAWVVLGLSLGLCLVVVVVVLTILFRKPRAPTNEREYEQRLRELKAERQM